MGLLDGLTGGASTLVGQVGVVCGLDSLTGCNGEIPLCCTNTDFVRLICLMPVENLRQYENLYRSTISSQLVALLRLFLSEHP